MIVVGMDTSVSYGESQSIEMVSVKDQNKIKHFATPIFFDWHFKNFYLLKI